MKILNVHTLFEPYTLGGAENISMSLALGLKKYGHDITVLSTSDKNKNTSFENIRDLKVVRIPIKNVYWNYNNQKPKAVKRVVWHAMDIYNPFMAKEVEKVIKKDNFDVAICHNITGFSSSIWSVLKKYDIPIVQVLHDLYSICPKSTMFNGEDVCKKRCFTCGLFRFMHPYFSKDISAVIGVSKFVLDKHLEYGLFKNAKIKTYIHNVLDIDKLPEVKVKKEEKTKFVFGFIGTLTPAKGIENLLKVFSQIEFDDVELLIAGKGNLDYEHYLKKNYNKNNIKFLGFQNPNEFFKRIDILIVPSIWNESFGLVILESFINMVTVIASKRGGIPEIVNEKNGYLFNPTDLKELREIIYRVLNNRDELTLKKEYISSIRDRYIDHDGWILEYIDVIKNLTREKIL